MAKLKPEKVLPYYILDEVKKDLNENFGKYAKNENYLDEQAFQALDEPEFHFLDEGEKIPLFPFMESCYIDDEAVQTLVVVYWYWALQEKEHSKKREELDAEYIFKYLHSPIEEIKKGAKDLLGGLKDSPMDKEDDLEFVLDHLSGRTYIYSEEATLSDALERIPGAEKENFIREEKEELGKTEYRFIDTSFGDDFYSMQRELERRGYKVSDITVTGDDSGDEISMGVDTLIGITRFLEERKYETQLKHWRSIVDDSKVLSEIEKRADLLFIL